MKVKWAFGPEMTLTRFILHIFLHKGQVASLMFGNVNISDTSKIYDSRLGNVEAKTREQNFYSGI